MTRRGLCAPSHPDCPLQLRDPRPRLPPAVGLLLRGDVLIPRAVDAGLLLRRQLWLGGNRCRRFLAATEGAVIRARRGGLVAARWLRLVRRLANRQPGLASLDISPEIV